MNTNLVLGVVLLMAAPQIEAQQGPRGPGGRPRIPDPVLFNGPPSPEEFVDLVGLDSTQYTAYRIQYVEFMEQTRPRRDSLLEFRRQVRDARQPGGEAVGRDDGEKLQKTMAEMEKQQKAFDQSLKKVLNDDQIKKYEAWRRGELARAEREAREQFGGPPR